MSSLLGSNYSLSLLTRLKSGYLNNNSKPDEKVVNEKQLNLKYSVTSFVSSISMISQERKNI